MWDAPSILLLRDVVGGAWMRIWPTRRLAVANQRASEEFILPRQARCQIQARCHRPWQARCHRPEKGWLTGVEYPNQEPRIGSLDKQCLLRQRYNAHMNSINRIKLNIRIVLLSKRLPKPLLGVRVHVRAGWLSNQSICFLCRSLSAARRTSPFSTRSPLKSIAAYASINALN